MPWCRRRCPYCDFFFEVGETSSNYVDALCLELEHRIQEHRIQSFDTIYFGGGTPSLLPTIDLKRLFKQSELNPKLSEESVIEANPEDLSERWICDIRDLGFHRISVGVQSFDDALLKKLGRLHRGQDAFNKLQRLKKYTGIGIDLIIGTPIETTKRLRNDLDHILRLMPQTVSLYMLTIEEETHFDKLVQLGKMPPTNDIKQLDDYHQAVSTLKEAGYIQTEVSNFRRPDYQTAHNEIYWAGGQYLGLGPGAHSLLISNESGLRAHQKADIQAYLKEPTSPLIVDETLDSQSLFDDFLAFGLRNLEHGVDIISLEQITGAQVRQTQIQVLERYVDSGHLTRFDNNIRVTPLGIDILDRIQGDLLFD